MKTLFSILFFVACFVQAKDTPILASMEVLKEAGIKVLSSDKNLGIGYARMSEASEKVLSRVAHSRKMCGGFQVISEEESQPRSLNSIFSKIKEIQQKDLNYLSIKQSRGFSSIRVVPKAEISEAVAKLDVENLKTWVQWLSNFKNRHSKAKDPNVHVVELEAKLKTQLSESKLPTEISLIQHKRTEQKTLRVRLIGKSKPSEIIVLGAHLDSISNQGIAGFAPGADDDASGVANLLEVLRVALTLPQSERTVEFLFYAAEEAGLVGSSEVASDYAKQKIKVKAVFQLDMTLFPASGKNVIGFTRDFTTPALNDVLEGLNSHYAKAKIIDDVCNYACSDHASWYREGFPVTYPFEGGNGDINGEIHTANDKINNKSDFEHALIFSKLGLAFMMEMSSSDHLIF